MIETLDAPSTPPHQLERDPEEWEDLPNQQLVWAGLLLFIGSRVALRRAAGERERSLLAGLNPQRPLVFVVPMVALAIAGFAAATWDRALLHRVLPALAGAWTVLEAARSVYEVRRVNRLDIDHRFRRIYAGSRAAGVCGIMLLALALVV